MRRLISSAENVFLHTYNRFPVVFGKGDGVYLYDTDEKKYLDFFAGIAVCGLGYGNERFTNAIQSQIDNLVHISNYFYSEPAVEAATKLARVSGMDRVFFTNSGTEAVEGALKMARKYAYDKGNFTKIEIIAVNHSFHGRSMGAVSVTGTDSYREPFGPMLDGVKFAEYNNIESIRSLITEDTCAIILETVQGEGGIYVAEPEF